MNKDNVLIIAEAGVNHNGDIEKAKQLIDVAAAAGVDFVKFQTFKANDLVSKLAEQAEYQKKNIDGQDGSQYKMLKDLELSDETHDILISYAKKSGINFFSTAFDVKGLDYLNSLGFELYKVPSGEITNYPYLKKLAHFAKPVILSTGMSDLKEIKEALVVLTSEKLKIEDITILHCNTEYPTPMRDVNIKAMLTIQKEFNVKVGYSDHTLGIEVPIASVALGARVIEKHFTLDRNLPGPDHRASLEPNELKSMVSAIRNIEQCLIGDGVKKPSPSEAKNKENVRKSIHLISALEKGQLIHESNLIALRPASGISPMKWNELVGRSVNTNLPALYNIKWEDVV